MRKCNRCEGDHEIIFSEELLEQYKEVCEAGDDRYDRAEQMLDLAKLFVEEADDSDEHMGEDIHALLTEVIENRVRYERSAMSLARWIIRALPAYIDVHKEHPLDPHAN